MEKMLEAFGGAVFIIQWLSYIIGIAALHIYN